MTIAVAVSGGGDSLAALLALRDAGHEVMALHGFFLPNIDDAAAKGLAEACARLGVPLHLLDLRAEFEALVAAPFAEEYLTGRTPNPCARCNAHLKFGLVLDRALELGADSLATGHFAACGTHDVYGWALARGVDPAKDQSYFLSLVPRERLSRAVFPLALRLKSEARAELERRNCTSPLPEESQEICFVPGDDYRAFLSGRCARLPEGGTVELPDGTVVGRHQGLWRTTIGQRRGLGIAWREPLYVLDKDLHRNVLVVAPREALQARSFLATEVNLLVEPRHWPTEVQVQTRYRESARPARVEVSGTSPGALSLVVQYFDPQLKPAPGQVAAVYDSAGVVLAGSVVAGS
ncbi:MAG: tRNA 2-thiouridine(34) synthase MnmA [Humidesulfovibrio sp.]|uniref:tRNA methyl transferase PRC-barrel domain-containing protein n=1 Tax=Humidesulfovibrio sp. TaxID=2910988 RepID=UPI0027E6DC64|nr:tRNA methyl transferase PRC-barrel domain-containing protein [Humidesulfovibrio sp.]MDQ7834148.1 tRNA 2-thiouridine(34) synthase MnmA [Humidesulfovibrio sp.]